MTTDRVMTPDELIAHQSHWLTIRSARASIASTTVEDEDVMVALARLDNWLTENEGRWTK